MRTAVVACGLAAALLVASPGGAAGPQVQDKTGDANGINSQGFIGGAPTDVQTAPASAAGLDIVSVQFASTGKTTTKVVRGRRTRVFTPDGFTVTLTLAAEPVHGVYRVIGAAGGCDTFWFQYFNDPIESSFSIRHTCNSSGDPLDFEDVPVTGKVAGKTIVWTAKLRSLPSPIKLGTSITDLGAETRGSFVAVTVPRVDEASSTQSYKIGS